MLRTCDSLARGLLARAQSLGRRQHWVGLAGGPGSGKSTLAAEVVLRLNALAGDQCGLVLPMDGFHYSHAELRATAAEAGSRHGYEQLLRRRGAPWTFDAESLCRCLLGARAAGRGSFPVYSRELSDPVPDGVQLRPSHRVIVVEGNYLLMWDDELWAPLRSAFDETWFLRCASPEEQQERLIARHLRGWTPEKAKLWGEGREGAASKVATNDMANQRVIEATIRNADRVIESVGC